MKNLENVALSVEQMNHIIELGIDTKYASMRYFKVIGGKEYELGVKNCSDEYLKKIMPELLLVPAFTLYDMLTILNKVEWEENDLDGGYHYYQARFWGDGYNQMAIVDIMNYDKSPMITTSNISPMQSAYEMLCWCAENNKIKTSCING